MLKADQIPPEVVAAIWATLKRDGGATMAEALAAGLSAWPGVAYRFNMSVSLKPQEIILPLPQGAAAPLEVSDE